MSGNLTLITRYGLRILFQQISLLQSHVMKLDILKMIVNFFDNIFIGTKNSLTNAIMMDDGRIAISGNGGSVTIVDLYKKTVETCVRSTV